MPGGARRRAISSAETNAMQKLELISIEGQGNLDKECVWLNVKEDIDDLAFYMVTDTTYTNDHHISNELRHVFWFPKMAVKKGDYIRLSTKKGKTGTTTNTRNTTTHLLFWGLGRTVWNQDGDCAVLFGLSGWETMKAGARKSA